MKDIYKRTYIQGILKVNQRMFFLVWRVQVLIIDNAHRS